MPYAYKDKISLKPIKDGIQISNEEYKLAIKNKQQGKIVYVKDKKLQTFNEKTYNVYSQEDGSTKRVSIVEPVPKGYTTKKRPDETYEWKNGKWVINKKKKDEKRIEEIKGELDTLDKRRIRPLAEGDDEYLHMLNKQIFSLRNELKSLKGE